LDKEKEGHDSEKHKERHEWSEGKASPWWKMIKRVE
jgi:hypothetical protein